VLKGREKEQIKATKRQHGIANNSGAWW